MHWKVEILIFQGLPAPEAKMLKANDGSGKFAGLNWDASESDKFRLFHGTATEPIAAKDIADKASDLEGLKAVIIKSKGTESLMKKVSESGIEIVIVPKTDVKGKNGLTIYAIDDF